MRTNLFLFILISLVIGFNPSKAVADDLEKLINKIDPDSVQQAPNYKVEPIQIQEATTKDLSEELQNIKPDQKLYLDIEEDQHRTVFSQPGYDYKSCEESRGQCEKLGWPDRDADLSYAGQVKKVITDSDKEPDAYIQVKYKHETADGEIKTDKGWMLAAPLKLKKYKPIYRKKKVVGPIKKCIPKSESAEDSENILESTEIKLNKEIESAVTQLKPVVGQCPLSPPNQVKSWDNRSVYDQAALPILKTKAIPKIKKEDGQSVSQQDVIAIDAMARSIYAEMANCFDDGLQYPLAVARVILNRADYVERERAKNHFGSASIFSTASDSALKSEITQVVLQSEQFSCWNKTAKVKNSKTGQLETVNNVSGLTQSLCPPVSESAPFWKGHKPDSTELDIWNNSLRIATEAVLYPENFKKYRTRGLENRYYYASGRANIAGMSVVRNVSVMGRPLSKKSCIKIYNGKPGT